METCIKIKIWIAIMQATIITYHKLRRQMDGQSASLRRQTYIGYITTARTSSADQTHKKTVFVGQPKKTRTRPATPKHDPAPRWRTRPLDS